MEALLYCFGRPFCLWSPVMRAQPMEEVVNKFNLEMNIT